MSEPFLYKRENGIYYIQWEDEKGTRRKSTKTKDYRRAKNRLNNFKRELSSGKVALIERGAKRKLKDFVKEFLDYKEPLVRWETHKNYRVAAEKAMASWGKDLPLSHISRRLIDVFISDMAKAGLKTPTINKNCRHLKHLLATAYEWEYINRPIKMPKQLDEEERARFLTHDQLRALLEKVDDPEFYDLFLFAAYTGLRAGEIVRLKWEDVDNPTGYLRITAEQKNKDEDRVPINSHSQAVLERCGARGGAKVFRWSSPNFVSRKFKAYLREAELPESVRFHDLRHTFGSHLAMSGRTGKEIQDLMRHRSYASTQVYMKLSPDHLREASESLNYGPLPAPRPIPKNKLNQ